MHIQKHMRVHTYAQSPDVCVSRYYVKGPWKAQQGIDGKHVFS